MTCANCGAPVEPVEHDFWTGLGPSTAEAAGKRFPTGEAWTVTAPLYYRASDDMKASIAAFCGARCGMEWTQERIQANG